MRYVWRGIARNYDHALADDAAREFLVELNANGFANVAWREGLGELHQEFPEFFAAHDYAWCESELAYDFPIEAAYQMRALEAAIAFWCAPLADKPIESAMGNIVARTTYFARFDQATPQAHSADGFDFIVLPLGWVELAHRLFAAFTTSFEGAAVTRVDHCKGIAANLIACSVVELEYALPGMIDAIVREVPEFHGGVTQLQAEHETDQSRDLAFAAVDFAISHELGHIAARDHHGKPDEFRADRWGLAAYLGSWPRKPPLHFSLARHDALRASVGPWAFTSVLRCSLGARAILAAHLGADTSDLEKRRQALRASIERSRALLLLADEQLEPHWARDASALLDEERASIVAFRNSLTRFEVELGQCFASFSTDACKTAAAVAAASEAKASG